jgi:hypothetical protein
LTTAPPLERAPRKGRVDPTSILPFAREEERFKLVGLGGQSRRS